MSRTRGFVLLLASVAVLGGSAGIATAQGRGGMMQASLARLIAMEEVQQELKLDGDALEKAKAIATEIGDSLRSQMQEIRDMGLSPEEMMDEMREVGQKLATEAETKLAEVVSPEQMTRLKQLFVQQLGATAVTREDVAAALGLDEETVKKIRAKVDELTAAGREKMRELMQGGDRDSMREAMTKNRQEIEDAVLGMLSEEQKKKFEEFKGAAFKFPEPQQRRPRNDF